MATAQRLQHTRMRQVVRAACGHHVSIVRRIWWQVGTASRAGGCQGAQLATCVPVLLTFSSCRACSTVVLAACVVDTATCRAVAVKVAAGRSRQGASVLLQNCLPHCWQAAEYRPIC